MAAHLINHAARDESRRTSDELLFLGQRCHHDACNLVDFLPFKCQYCSQSYCGSHFLPAQHPCPSLPPAYTLDRVAPLCPLCSTPISTFPGEDPNIPMNRHIGSKQCVGAEGKKEEIRRKRERGDVCWRRGCGKVLIAKIKCESCRRDFCPSHRFPKDHHCASISSNNSSTSSLAPRPTTTTSPSTGVSFLGDKLKSAFSSTSTSPPSTSQTRKQLDIPSAGPKQAAALAAMKRFGQTAPPSTSSSTAGASAGPEARQAPRVAGSSQVAKTASRASSTGVEGGGIGGGLKKMWGMVGPASSTEKHARAESDALFLSLENRHKKGLLSKADQLKFAEMVAIRESERRRGFSKKHPIEL